jgi:hypothetical protein
MELAMELQSKGELQVLCQVNKMRVRHPPPLSMAAHNTISIISREIGRETPIADPHPSI